MKAIPEVIKIASRSLRKNMTQSEEKLWDKLKARKLNGIKF
jgi:very-short-patch-repair endonuclease